uniref:Uncharacterized protein n=1 Tax=Sinocyclocheilus rhinocerous TaxID=307959 RepID=A0A673N360_9TELE
MSLIDQDHLFSLLHHAQHRRMDDQRCSFEPFKNPSSSPKNPNASPTGNQSLMVANFQSGRLDDQRVTLSALPGIQNSSTGTKRENDKTSAPQIILTPASPATSFRTFFFVSLLRLWKNCCINSKLVCAFIKHNKLSSMNSKIILFFYVMWKSNLCIRLFSKPKSLYTMTSKH